MKGQPSGLMKALTVTGWVLFALEALLVLLLFLSRDMGDDAAGRGMARGFAYLLAPIVLGAGALLLWGSAPRPTPLPGARAAFWIGFGIVSLPLAYGAFSFVTGSVRKLERAIGRAEYGRFDASAMTALARAIEREDLDEVRRRLREERTAIDFAARDRRGRTILGHAITHVLAYDATDTSVESVRLLLDAGAPPADNAIAPERTSAEPDGHHLVVNLIGGNTPRALRLLDLLLGAGLSPNGVDMDDRPILFSTYLDLPELEILLKHGVDVQARDTRSDQPGWSTLMQAIAYHDWPVAHLYLDRGVAPDYVAPDGQSAIILIEAVREQQLAQRPDGSGQSSGGQPGGQPRGGQPDEELEALLTAMRARVSATRATP